MPRLVTRYRKDKFLGDGVLIWKSEEQAEIYALAEFISPVDIFAPDASVTTVQVK